MKFLSSQGLPVSINQPLSLEVIQCSSEQHSMGMEMSLDILRKKPSLPEMSHSAIKIWAEYQMRIISSARQAWPKWLEAPGLGHNHVHPGWSLGQSHVFQKINIGVPKLNHGMFKHSQKDSTICSQQENLELQQKGETQKKYHKFHYRFLWAI